MRSFGLFAVLTLALVACGDDGTSGAHDAGPMDGRLGAQCDDGVDNDGDGKTDFPADPGCSAPNADSETDDCPSGAGCPQCANGRDDDGNGTTDYPGDPGCESASDPIEVTVNPVACGATMMIKDLPNTGMDTGSLGTGAASTSQIVSPCGGGGGAAAIAYRIILTQPAVIIASTAGSQLDTVLDLRSAMCSATDAEIACNDDVDTGDLTSRLVRSLQPGVYYLIVEGTDTSETGAYTLVVEKRAGEGTPCTDVAQCGPGLVCRTPYGGSAMVCTAPQCGDTLDDDQDTKNGYPTDPGCDSPEDNDETDPVPLPACSDGVDNDNDQTTDYPADTSCPSAAGQSEACSGERDPIVAITAGTTTSTLVGARDDHDATCDSEFDGSGPDRLFTLRLPAMRTLTLDTIGSTSEAALSLLSPTCAEPSLACNAYGADLDAIVTTGALAAGTYVVAVDNYSADTSFYPLGPISLHVSGVIAPGGSCNPSDTLGGALACPALSPCEGTTGALRCRATACSDGFDNDTDTKMDFPADPGCLSADDDDESDTCASGVGPGCPQCADGVDNDSDTMTDYPNDPACAAPSSASEGCLSTEPVPELVLAVTLGDTTTATDDVDATCGSSSGTAHDRMYSLRLPALVDLAIDVTTDVDGAVELLQGACDGASLDCGDVPESVAAAPVAAGTYFFLVDGYGAGDDGPYVINVSGTIVDGESCESPLALTGALHCGFGRACIGTPGARTCGRPQCSDGVDNDTDTKTDYPFDPGCATPLDDSEADPVAAPVCSNGLDDDTSGGTDWPADYGCSSAGGASEVFCATETNPTSLITTPVVTGTTMGATSDYAAQSCSYMGDGTGPDVALALSLPVPVETLTLDLAGSSFDTELSLRDTSCATEYACDEDGGTGVTSLLELTNVNAGNYAVIIDGYAGEAGTYSLAVHGVVAPGTACDSPLFAAGVLTCPTATTCSGATMRCQ